jgi:hypothetical protein
MTVNVQSSMSERHHVSRAVWPIAFAMAWLLFRVPSLPGQQNSTEPTVTAGGDETAPSTTGGYSGPAILSRGTQPAVTGGEYDSIQPFLSVNRIYGTGLNGALSGPSPNALQSGLDLGFGLRATHRWRKATLQVEYTDSYRDYTGHTVENGLNQFITATLVSRLRRHLLLSIRQTGGILKQDIGSLLIQPDLLESSSTLPASEPFSTGMKLVNSTVTLTYQKTRRLSFSGSINGSVVRENSALLVGLNSFTGSADVNYRLSSRSNIGMDSSFSHFTYTTFGSTNVESVAVDYSWRATRSIDLSLQLGIAHSDTLGLAIVPIDPAVGALLGESNAIQASHWIINTPMMNIRVKKQWHRTSADLGYQRGVSPGNGLAIASTQESLIAGLHYSSAKRWTVSLQAGRTTLADLDGAGSYTETTVGASFERLIRPGVQAVARFDILPVNYAGLLGLNRTYYRGEIGFMFSPKEIPITLR